MFLKAINEKIDHEFKREQVNVYGKFEGRKGRGTWHNYIVISKIKLHKMHSGYSTEDQYVNTQLHK